MRLSVHKTLKMYVGGSFIRSESGRTVGLTNAAGEHMNVPLASRKDFRNAMEKARPAQGGWAARTAYNRGQILYRLAEMLEGRASTLPAAGEDTQKAIDRAVHYAGWTDKITAILSSLNPVGMAYVNYSMVRPLGVTLSIPNPADGLLGMVEALCASLVMGNATILMVSTETAEIAVALTECLATSDMPAGVVNVLTGDIHEVLKVASRHDDLDGIYIAETVLNQEQRVDCEVEAARVMRRFMFVPGAAQPARPSDLVQLAEVQTVWMSSMGNMPGGGSAY
jgi:acyl-CoA reductase-like NAD-dependent aldehyde dehydrogenase